MIGTNMSDFKPTQLDKFKALADRLETDTDPERFKQRLGKLVRHRLVEKPDPAA